MNPSRTEWEVLQQLSHREKTFLCQVLVKHHRVLVAPGMAQGSVVCDKSQKVLSPPENPTCSALGNSKATIPLCLCLPGVIRGTEIILIELRTEIC